jgi:hypothetical protein
MRNYIISPHADAMLFAAMAMQGSELNLPLPLADCKNCQHSQNNTDGGHCYMFKESPGTHCGQFTPQPAKELNQ